MSFQPTIALLVLVAAQSSAAQQISYETVRVTDGVHVPETGVVIAGDLLTHPFLAAAEAFPGEWIVTLERMAALEPDVIVPGHGPVLRDRDHLELMIRLLSAVVGQVRDAAERGLSADGILDSIDVDELRGQLLGDDAMKRRAFEAFFLRPSVESVLREAAADR